MEDHCMYCLKDIMDEDIDDDMATYIFYCFYNQNHNIPFLTNISSALLLFLINIEF